MFGGFFYIYFRMALTYSFKLVVRMILLLTHIIKAKKKQKTKPKTTQLLEAMNNPLFLGIDVSTQGVKATLVDHQGTVTFQAELARAAVNYDRDLPHFGTTGGCIERAAPDGGVEATVPSAMFPDALELLFRRLAAEHVPLDRVAAGT